MPNLKKLVEQIQMSRGECQIPVEKFMTIPAIRINCVTGNHTEVQINWVISYKWDHPVIDFLNGVTGYESYYLRDMVEACKDTNHQWIWLCAGTENKYDELKVHKADMQTLIDSLLIQI